MRVFYCKVLAAVAANKVKFWVFEFFTAFLAYIPSAHVSELAVSLRSMYPQGMCSVKLVFSTLWLLHFGHRLWRVKIVDWQFGHDETESKKLFCKIFSSVRFSRKSLEIVSVSVLPGILFGN